MINNIIRRKSRTVKVGSVRIGGDAPVTVQSMTISKTNDVRATLEEIRALHAAGCDIARVAVPRKEDANALADIVKESPLPIVADIHFNHVFALKAVEAGVAKIRINPGNIGHPDRERQVLDACKEKNIPIRIGVNSGSLEKDILDKYGFPKPEALYESAMRHVDICEKNDFTDVVISVKHSSVKYMIDAYRLLAAKVDYPLHLGVTEAGTVQSGTIKSCVGIGTLLAEGIGDTIRVSLTADSVKEVEVGKTILKSLGLTAPGINIIACPTCGRLEVDLFRIAEEVENAVKKYNKNINIALMGCVVNGPGEAGAADLGVACGSQRAILFRKGEVLRHLKEEEIIPALIEQIEIWK